MQLHLYCNLISTGVIQSCVKHGGCRERSSKTLWSPVWASLKQGGELHPTSLFSTALRKQTWTTLGPNLLLAHNKPVEVFWGSLNCKSRGKHTALSQGSQGVCQPYRPTLLCLTSPNHLGSHGWATNHSMGLSWRNTGPAVSQGRCNVWAALNSGERSVDVQGEV